MFYLRKYLLQNDHVKNWYFSRDNFTDWADILIMGNSMASAGINPEILQKNLKSKQTVWNIAQPGDAPSIDYFNLDRLLTMCRKYPKTIVYQVSELGFKNGEIKSWQGEIYDNLERLFINMDEQNETLKEAASYDLFYNDVYHTFQLNRMFRPYLLRRQLLSIVKRNVYNRIFHTTTVEASQILESPLVGYWDRKNKLTRPAAAFSIKLLEGYFEGYKTGKANELFFKRFVATAKAYNLKVVFVEMPLSPIYFEHFKSVQEAFQQQTKEIYKEMDIKVKDDKYLYSDLSMFSDIHHLNMYGAEKFTVNLAKWMNRLL